VSKWKYIRKEHLLGYATYEWIQGFFLGAFMALISISFVANRLPQSRVYFVQAAVFGLFAVVHWYYRRGQFTRIRKAIDYAGGDT